MTVQRVYLNDKNVFQFPPAAEADTLSVTMISAASS